MEKKIFRTLIKQEEKLGNNEYVRGRISGIQAAITGTMGKAIRGVSGKRGGMMFSVECTESQYKTFAELVGEMYPGLCSFNV